MLTDEWRATIARWSIGSPYFSPGQIEFISTYGVDIRAILCEAAKQVRFFFEGGDGEIVRKFVLRNLDKRA